METPTSGQTHGRYKSIFGRAPEQSASLFALKYCQGREALGSFAPDGIEGDNFFSYAEICVAPSRFVYIQAQILTLTEYVTEGVLGAIFERVASSAAAAIAPDTHGSFPFRPVNVESTSDTHLLPARSPTYVSSMLVT